MGLKDLFSRWTKGEDERAVQRERDDELNRADRNVADEDYEAKKDDLAAANRYGAADAEAAASDDLP
jgi:hypothetical protein